MHDQKDESRSFALMVSAGGVALVVAGLVLRAVPTTPGGTVAAAPDG